MTLFHTLKVRLLTLLAAWLAPSAAFACKLALVLAFDVSSSIDGAEYRFQVDGLADALLDPAIADTLVFNQVALTVVQWSGAGEVETTIPWRRMLSINEVRRFSDRVRNMERPWRRSNTAVGDAIAHSASLFAEVPDCTRRVIDVSGDGAENAGVSTRKASQTAADQGIEINGLAIDTMGLSITEFYRRFVITKFGFVITSRGFSDYPRSIREKLFRELIKPAS